jgi:hypothetical protein
MQTPGTQIRRLKIFTWHIHGSYLFYLSQGDYDIYIPIDERRSPGYSGRGNTFAFGNNVIEVSMEQVKEREFDLILFQNNQNYLADQYVTLSAEQRRLPKIYLEHNPPWQHPINERHLVDDESVTLVHVTNFNAQMWDNGNLETYVIEPGVLRPRVAANLQKNKGLVVANHIMERGRMAGADIFAELSQDVPLDLVGMGTHTMGEVLHPLLPELMASYRFFFNPMRYTSFDLAVCEAMMLGLPVISLATTAQASVIQNGVDGFVSNNNKELKQYMKLLLNEPEMAREMGLRARQKAEQKFNIQRFTGEWTALFAEKCGMLNYKQQHHEKASFINQ